MELGAPELARLGMTRLNSARLALLGTLRRDGSPRISPHRALPRRGPTAHRCHDLVSEGKRPAARSAVCTLHSVVTGPDTGEGEFKLYGRAVQATARTCALRQPMHGGWPGRRKRPSSSACTLGMQRSSTGTSKRCTDDGPPVDPGKRLHRGQPPLPVAKRGISNDDPQSIIIVDHRRRCGTRSALVLSHGFVPTVGGRSDRRLLRRRLCTASAARVNTQVRPAKMMTGSPLLSCPVASATIPSTRTASTNGTARTRNTIPSGLRLSLAMRRWVAADDSPLLIAQ